ncbi:ATP-binding protein [Streptomyces platensis]|uniref:ATP-binding protein n=2 Tax=Streptomyces platensis TaxID=58346 RepID=A0AAE6NIQ4_STRPT|nr:Histidine kinase-, DNA gyrase B-, and HSP90-like ATPase [Streptomyces platensis]QEV52266.1 ATP-binding protein [Streptomyces platensis]
MSVRRMDRSALRPRAIALPYGATQLEQFRALTLFTESSDTVQAARKLVRSALEDWALGALVDDVVLCASELVGNAVHHAIPDDRLAVPTAARRIDVTLTKWPKWLFLGVTDEDSSPPQFSLGKASSPELVDDPPEPALLDSGRGLRIVQVLADSLWWSPEEVGGKTVFCRFDLVGRASDGRT